MAVNTAGAILLTIGFLAAMTGIGLMYFSVEDQQRNDGWFFQDNERTDDNVQRYEAGRILSVLGLITVVVGGALSATRSGGF